MPRPGRSARGPRSGRGELDQHRAPLPGPGGQPAGIGRAHPVGGRRPRRRRPHRSARPPPRPTARVAVRPPGPGGRGRARPRAAAASPRSARPTTPPRRRRPTARPPGPTPGEVARPPHRCRPVPTLDADRAPRGRPPSGTSPVRAGSTGTVRSRASSSGRVSLGDVGQRGGVETAAMGPQYRTSVRAWQVGRPERKRPTRGPHGALDHGPCPTPRP